MELILNLCTLSPRAQHKKEAFWFYRYLSIVYDYIVNPGHWTDDMRVVNPAVE